jgi:hypothetical protein
MRKSTSCCFAATSVLALILCAQASPAGAMIRSAGLHAVLGAGSVVLVADEKDEAPPATTKKPRKKRASTKNEVDKGIKKYVPKEYQRQIQQYMQQGGAGQGGIGQGGAGQ